jgi:hypothetical protein
MTQKILNEDVARLVALAGMPVTEAPKKSASAKSSAPRPSDTDYQSNSQTVTSPGSNKVNWGDPNSSADFFRADKAMRAQQPAATPTTSNTSSNTSPTRTVSTKGGNYPVYPKASPEAGSFRDAFAQARQDQGPGGTFTWQGRQYSTNRADDKPGAAKATPTTGAKAQRNTVGGTSPEFPTADAPMPANPTPVDKALGYPQGDAPQARTSPTGGIYNPPKIPGVNDGPDRSTGPNKMAPPNFVPNTPATTASAPSPTASAPPPTASTPYQFSTTPDKSPILTAPRNVGPSPGVDPRPLNPAPELKISPDQSSGPTSKNAPTVDNAKDLPPVAKGPQYRTGPGSSDNIIPGGISPNPFSGKSFMKATDTPEKTSSLSTGFGSDFDTADAHPSIFPHSVIKELHDMVQDEMPESVEECSGGDMSPMSNMHSSEDSEPNISMNSSFDSKTGHKTLTVTADGEAAEQLAQILKMAGLR